MRTSTYYQESPILYPQINRNKLTIIQHNVNKWNDEEHALVNIYNDINADIILINDHSLTDDNRLKIFNYNVHCNNKANRLDRGSAIPIKKDINYRLLDDFETDLLAVSIDTRKGAITTANDYIPPNSPYLHFIEYLSLLNRTEPVYILGDLNARHRIYGHNDFNQIGRNIKTIIDSDRCRHVGPDFPTFLRQNCSTSPDIVLTNNRVFHNIDLRPLPITPSDHIPIIATITCNPILIKIKCRRQYSKANWTDYKNSMTNFDPPDGPHPTLEDIDAHIDSWRKIIHQATELHIPKINYRTIPGIKPTELTKYIQVQYDAALVERTRNGPTIEITRLLSDLKRRLSEEYRRLQNGTWNDIICICKFVWT